MVFSDILNIRQNKQKSSHRQSSDSDENMYLVYNINTKNTSKGIWQYGLNNYIFQNA